MSLEQTRAQLLADGRRFWGSDNIADQIEDCGEIKREVAEHFGKVFDALLIDWKNDPNMRDTPNRLARMYVDEIFSGRYRLPPTITSFPNGHPDEVGYDGIIVVSCAIHSVCAHHLQPVVGKCYIGVLPHKQLIGLSKYQRIVSWLGERPTLQEDLTKQISEKVKKEIGSNDVGVHIRAEHGCMKHRGVKLHDSKTYTTQLSGMFYNSTVKEEFFSYIRSEKP